MRGVVLLVTYGESAIAQAVSYKKNSDEKYYLFRIYWLYLSDKIALLKNYSFKDIFIIFISVTYGEFFTNFWLQQQIYFCSTFDGIFFSNLTFDGCKPVTHLMI